MAIENEQLEEVAMRQIAFGRRAPGPSGLPHRILSDLGVEGMRLIRARRIGGDSVQKPVDERLRRRRVGILDHQSEGLRPRGNATPPERWLVAAPIRRVPGGNWLAMAERIAREADVGRRLHAEPAMRKPLLASAFLRNASEHQMRQASQQRAQDMLGLFELHGAKLRPRGGRRSLARPSPVPNAGPARLLPAFAHERHPVKVRRPMSRPIALLLVFAFGGLAACKRSEDQAAKRRIFSPEEPVGALAEAKETIDASKLADDPRLADRVARMSQAEVAARVGAHKAQTRVQFAWFRGAGAPDAGGSDVALAEETTLLQAADGGFSVRQENDRNQGFELVWVNGEVFVRGLFGPFRKRRTDRSDPERVRELALGALPTFDRLARGLKLQKVGEATVEGRRVIRYQVTGSAGRPRTAEREDLPRLEYPLEPDGGRGADPDTARRLEMWEKEEPTRVSGALVVDALTGVAIGSDLQGHFRIPGAQGAAAELDVHSVLTTSAIGKDPAVRAPQYEPEPSVPHAVKDPLRFLGKAPAAGGAPSAEEPATDESEDEAPEQAADQSRQH